MEIKNFNLANVGKYVCKTQNDLGEASKEVSISIKLAPTVKLVPDKMTLQAGKTGTFECNVNGAEGDFMITWKDEFGVEKRNVSLKVSQK